MSGYRPLSGTRWMMTLAAGLLLVTLAFSL